MLSGSANLRYAGVRLPRSSVSGDSLYDNAPTGMRTPDLRNLTSDSHLPPLQRWRQENDTRDFALKRVNWDNYFA